MVTRLNAHIYCSESSLPHCWCFVKDSYHQSCCRIMGSFVIKRSRKWSYFCFKSARCRENLSMWKESYFLNSRKKQELMDDFFSDFVCHAPCWRILFHSYHLIWVKSERRVERCQFSNRQFGKRSALHLLSVGSSRHLFWQLQQFDEGRKRSLTKSPFLIAILFFVHRRNLY